MEDWKALCVRQGMELKAKEAEVERLKGLLSENATPFLSALMKEEDRLRQENNQLRADKRELVEVAGIEPASCDGITPASTCLFRLQCLSSRNLAGGRAVL